MLFYQYERRLGSSTFLALRQLTYITMLIHKHILYSCSSQYTKETTKNTSLENWPPCTCCRPYPSKPIPSQMLGNQRIKIKKRGGGASVRGGVHVARRAK